MTRFILLTLFVQTTLTTLMAQTTHNISMGSGYAKGEYYNLSTDNQVFLNHADWDIAFSVHGTTDAGIFINEASTYSGTPPKLYEVSNKTFVDNISISDLGSVLKNPEETWETGAFNTIRDASDWTDYGWGRYNMSNHKVLGTKLYVIELSNGAHKKMTIDSLVRGVYYFRYADLDGSNLQQNSVDKSTFPNQTLAYFSFTTNMVSSGEPTGGWDFLFTRYETTLYAAGTPMPYTVGGILINQGVEAVIADGINPTTVDAANYTLGKDSLTIIGHDWKSYSLGGAGWAVDNDRVYFVKTANDQLYKIEFIDFQGSSSGTATFQKTDLGLWTSLEDKPDNVVAQLGAFPNPATTEVNVTFSLNQATEGASLYLTNALGQMVYEQGVNVQSGLNGLVLSVDDLPRGTYFLTLQAAAEVHTTAIVLK